MVRGSVKLCPSTVRRTVYFPGKAIGPTSASRIPQCKTCRVSLPRKRRSSQTCGFSGGVVRSATSFGGSQRKDRKSTRLNSSHGYISYAVFCLKKKKNTIDI